MIVISVRIIADEWSYLKFMAIHPEKGSIYAIRRLSSPEWDIKRNSADMSELYAIGLPAFRRRRHPWRR